MTQATKAAAEEARAPTCCATTDVDLVVLARYMQVLTARLHRRLPNGVINIHHGFLPAFAGARPYHQASERGVKLIGVQQPLRHRRSLDDGPIIDQDVIRVTHRDAVG